MSGDWLLHGSQHGRQVFHRANPRRRREHQVPSNPSYNQLGDAATSPYPPWSDAPCSSWPRYQRFPGAENLGQTSQGGSGYQSFPSQQIQEPILIFQRGQPTSDAANGLPPRTYPPSYIGIPPATAYGSMFPNGAPSPYPHYAAHPPSSPYTNTYPQNQPSSLPCFPPGQYLRSDYVSQMPSILGKTSGFSGSPGQPYASMYAAVEPRSKDNRSVRTPMPQKSGESLRERRQGKGASTSVPIESSHRHGHLNATLKVPYLDKPESIHPQPQSHSRTSSGSSEQDQTYASSRSPESRRPKGGRKKPLTPAGREHAKLVRQSGGACENCKRKKTKCVHKLDEDIANGTTPKTPYTELPTPENVLGVQEPHLRDEDENENEEGYAHHTYGVDDQWKWRKVKELTLIRSTLGQIAEHIADYKPDSSNPP